MQTTLYKGLGLGILFLFSATAYLLLGYFTIRTDVFQVFELFALLFVAYGVGYKLIRSTSDVYLALGAALLFRLLLLFSFPNLSDDFYRFCWDGRLLAQGISPFAYLPVHFFDGTYTGITIPGIDRELFEQLNSPEYYTIYPPVLQVVFWLAGKLFPTDLHGAVVVMKVVVFLFEVGSMYLLYRLAQHFKVSEKRVLLYALNPLVIVELTGNLHFEAAMIFFVLLGGCELVKYEQKKAAAKWSHRSAVSFSLAINSKLLPLMFLPFFIKRLGRRRSLIFFLTVGFYTLFFLLIIFRFDVEVVQNLLASVGLYINKFEFNGSIYYLLRGIGYGIFGFNLIHILGKVLAVLTFLLIVWMAWKERVKGLALQQLFTFLLLALFIYLAFANIVHPWYVCPLVAFCVFTPFRFPILWSALIVLSYFTYLTDAYTENLWLVAVEYLLVYGFLVWEWGSRKLFNPGV